MTLALKWAHRDFVLYCDEFTSLDDAVHDAASAAARAEESVECIEVWDDNGRRLIERKELNRLMAAVWAEEDKIEPWRPVAGVECISPDGQPGEVAYYSDLSRAQDKYEHLAAIVGAGRVVLRFRGPYRYLAGSVA